MCIYCVYVFMLTDLYGVMGDPVSASEYYQLHNSFTKQLLDSKLPYKIILLTFKVNL